MKHTAKAIRLYSYSVSVVIVIFITMVYHEPLFKPVIYLFWSLWSIMMLSMIFANSIAEAIHSGNKYIVAKFNNKRKFIGYLTLKENSRLDFTIEYECNSKNAFIFRKGNIWINNNKQMIMLSALSGSKFDDGGQWDDEHDSGYFRIIKLETI